MEWVAVEVGRYCGGGDVGGLMLVAWRCWPETMEVRERTERRVGAGVGCGFTVEEGVSEREVRGWFGVEQEMMSYRERAEREGDARTERERRGVRWSVGMGVVGLMLTGFNGGWLVGEDGEWDGGEWQWVGGCGLVKWIVVHEEEREKVVIVMRVERGVEAKEGGEGEGCCGLVLVSCSGGERET